jgi:hypothetical protein
MPLLKLGAGSIASRLPKPQDPGSWDKLLDVDLRAAVIAYGELAEAAYDGFNYDENSPGAGSCLYGPAGLLAASGVSHPEYYTVTQFLLATCDPGLEPSSKSISKALFVQQPERPWGSESRTNWIGYVAVATDEGVAALGRRDIVVAWRGAVNILEYLKDTDFRYTSAAKVLDGKFPEAQVDSGILSVYTTNNPSENHMWNTNIVLMTSARDQVNLDYFISLNLYVWKPALFSLVPLFSNISTLSFSFD